MGKMRRMSNTTITLIIILTLIFILLAILGYVINESENTPPNLSGTTDFTAPELPATEQEEITTSTEAINSTEASEPEITLPPETTGPVVTEPIVTDKVEETEISTPIVEEPNYIGTIYLTFDDGPSSEITSQILDILKQKNVKATFFILDYEFGSEIEALVCREINEGHTVGIHGISHDYSKIYTSLENLVKNFTNLQEKIYKSTGYRATIIRFPGGSSNTVSEKYCPKIMTQAVEYFSNNTDFVYFDWNVDSDDAGKAKSIDTVYENVTTALRPNRGNVVLMHDSSSKKFTLGALEAIIDYGMEHGYEFKAITPDTPQVAHRVSN